ncbi:MULTISPECIES: sugar transferase [unclassified Mesorhizobium]|uniref:sugar transferase n=1 Tax=unclassified Mesorhizobium TaxID=325217 RepID=UPI001128159E|nr:MULTISPECIES: sugar transferase [unclassified Mesorhizobium]MBZ9703496.1 sugar transferase [Mesorhizobium sp. CO1-1-3]MBZ9949442.1 sugar transferase [Mesorhizobium sp. BR1-1-11]TPJ01996.1 sugar transferase [Mesorhizobium sp. B2-8-1]
MIGLSTPTARSGGWTARVPLGRAMPSRIAAVILLVLSLPLWLVAAAIVWVSVGRPLFFRQSRSGLEGRPFVICKFRTMHEGRDGNGMLLPDALRETPATRLMRSVRIDELPQLLSIARGDMAFMGPRPLLPATIAEFGELGRIRGTVRPGLSGWAQVNGNTRLTNSEKLALDLWYVRNRSLWLDLHILVLTVQVALLGERVDRRHVDHALKAMPAGTVRP